MTDGNSACIKEVFQMDRYVTLQHMGFDLSLPYSTVQRILVCVQGYHKVYAILVCYILTCEMARMMASSVSCNIMQWRETTICVKLLMAVRHGSIISLPLVCDQL